MKVEKTYCDKCGKEFESYDDSLITLRRLEIYLTLNNPFEYRKVDLCLDCNERLYNFIFGNRKENYNAEDD